MAGKSHKSHAEKAVAATKKTSKTTSVTKKSASSKKLDKINQKSSNNIPIRVISSLVCLGLFILFLITFFFPNGALIEFLSNFIHGMIGRVGFVVSIPVLLYLFIIHAFSGTRPIRMRTICLLCFIACCGCIAHLGVSQGNLLADMSVIAELYTGGADGTTSGLICGGIAEIVKFLLGPVYPYIFPYIVLILSALLTLLGGMQITIPSIIRAIQNRPRSEFEIEKEERQEPATIVVNHLTNRHIAHQERIRQGSVNHDNSKSIMTKQDTIVNRTEDLRKNEFFRQIDGDVEEPVAAAGTTQPVIDDPEIIPIEKKQTPIPAEMPVFDPDSAIVDAPITEPKKRIKEKVTAQDAEQSAQEVAEEIAQAESIEKQQYCFPPIDLLKNASGGAADGTAEMRENSRRLNETLASFKIEAHIINVTRGPSVTRYEVELEKGVRLSKLTTAADDIALSLGATGVRIAAVPGKISVVGIEVPNRAVTTVSLREVIDSQEFNKAKSKSSFAVGKDIGGSCIVGNISKLPHMLIAGTTGSGKSVCMNSIIISLLYKASPDDVKLIMVDPKMVELGIYNGIPHLLIPVVTDPKKAAGSLQWAVTEMLRRYKAMSDVGVRDLESYNSIIESQETDSAKLPQVVVIIDELADLMLVAAKEVEESICRIAQMGRAAGIHLIIATQRPSADVITGLMKANIPSRIAFAVASAMESRIILDTQGAEKLVGKGDMLFAPIGNGKPKRVQGCFVSDPEVEAVANYVKANYTTNYDQQVLEEIEKKAATTGNKSAAADPEPNKDETSEDEMLPAAVDVILETGQASVSMLQRRLKLGYARAARIVDEMEKKGIVGPFMGAKPRNILITKEQWESMRSGQSNQMDFDDINESFDNEPVPEDF